MRYFGAMINSPADAIDILGGKNAVSARIKRPLTTVASWAKRASIPVDVWPSLIEMAGERSVKGITYETLAKAHTRGTPKRRRAA